MEHENKLQDWINKNDSNFSKFAKSIGYTQCHISMVARGKTKPSFKLAVIIEKVTNKEVPRTIWYPAD